MKDEIWNHVASGLDPYKRNLREVKQLFVDVNAAQRLMRSADATRRPKQNANSFRYRYTQFMRLAADMPPLADEPYAFETRFLTRVLSAYAFIRLLEKKFNYADVQFVSANDYNLLANRMATWGAAIFAGELVGLSMVNDIPDGTERELSIGQLYANFHQGMSTPGVPWYEWAAYALYQFKGYKHANPMARAGCLTGVREYLACAASGKAWHGLCGASRAEAERLVAMRTAIPQRTVGMDRFISVSALVDSDNDALGASLIAMMGEQEDDLPSPQPLAEQDLPTFDLRP